MNNSPDYFGGYKGWEKKHLLRKRIYISISVIVVLLGLFLMCVVMFFGSEEHGADVVVNHSFAVLAFLVVVMIAPILVAVMFLRVAFKRNERVKALQEQLDMLDSDIGSDSTEFGTASAKTDKESKQRFSKLSEKDERARYAEVKVYENDVTFEQFCTNFRSFAANRLGLYYDKDQIRQFVAGMGTSKILIMQGMSGTGKTSLAYAFGEFLSNPSTIVPIQPMWKDRTDLVGYYNEFTKKFNETTLLEKMYEANRSQDIFVTVLDEMNIARVEYYFAEFLSLLEIPNEQSRYLDVVPDKWDDDPIMLKNGKINLPSNMWFIGTANNDDSTFAIADKVYDRAMVMNLDTKAKPFSAPFTKPMSLSVKQWNKMVKDAVVTYEMTDRNRRRIAELDAYMIDNFHISFGNRIMKQINTYVPLMLACGGDEVAALDDILSKKILRKLESCNPIYVKNSAEAFRNYLDELFGYDKMKSCKSYLTQLERNA